VTSSERSANIRPVVSTYRVQLNRGFGFSAVARIVPYLHRLGITHLYASPIFAAAPGSSHGYDVIDPTRLNPELGTPDEFEKLVDALHRHDMGLIIDIVPNHQATSAENPAWMSVLELGQESPYAGTFDIVWERAGGKVVLPVLGRPLNEVLEAGEIKVSFDGGRPEVRYYDHRFPLSPESRARLAATEQDQNNQQLLRELLEKQHYQLVFWREASEKVNYRRFFDINDLVGVRVEDPSVFKTTHQLVFSLAKSGAIDGVRIDHVDGLADPLGYLQRLDNELRRLTGAKRCYIVVEKILGRDEELVPDWPVDGSTGYDFLRMVNDLFVDPDGLRRLKSDYADRVGPPEDFELTADNAKRQIIEDLFAGYLNASVRQIESIARRSTEFDGISSSEIREALTEVTCRLDVYRTYGRDGYLPLSDRRRIDRAVAAAQDLPNIDLRALALVRRVLSLELGDDRSSDVAAECQQVVTHWQQLSGAVMAKSVEDTVFYRYCPLLSLNEVGSDPEVPPDPVAAFHDWNLRAAARWPRTMTTTSTHDTKRGEGARARLNVLSEMPEEWNEATRRWIELNQRHKHEVDRAPVPDIHDELFIYQALLGVWPADHSSSDDLRERLHTYLTKALREAKRQTSWREPDEPYEQATHEFLTTILDPSRGREFISDFSQFVGRVSSAGTVNALSQLLLKLTAVGVPDTYRGTEGWDLSLADPDNRRPVDFTMLSQQLANERLESGGEAGETTRDLLAGWPDGRIKQHVLSRILNFRRRHPELFLEGDYVPLSAGGELSQHVVAFARRNLEDWSLTITPRLIAKLVQGPGSLCDPSLWADSTLVLPDGAPDSWRDVLTGAGVRAARQNGNTVIKLEDVFRFAPFAQLVASS